MSILDKSERNFATAKMYEALSQIDAQIQTAKEKKMDGNIILELGVLKENIRMACSNALKKSDYKTHLNILISYSRLFEDVTSGNTPEAFYLETYEQLKNHDFTDFPHLKPHVEALLKTIAQVKKTCAYPTLIAHRLSSALLNIQVFLETKEGQTDIYRSRTYLNWLKYGTDDVLLVPEMQALFADMKRFERFANASKYQALEQTYQRTLAQLSTALKQGSPSLQASVQELLINPLELEKSTLPGLFTIESMTTALQCTYELLNKTQDLERYENNSKNDTFCILITLPKNHKSLYHKDSLSALMKLVLEEFKYEEALTRLTKHEARDVVKPFLKTLLKQVNTLKKSKKAPTQDLIKVLVETYHLLTDAKPNFTSYEHSALKMHGHSDSFLKEMGNSMLWLGAIVGVGILIGALAGSFGPVTLPICLAICGFLLLTGAMDHFLSRRHGLSKAMGIFAEKLEHDTKGEPLVATTVGAAP